MKRARREPVRVGLARGPRGRMSRRPGSRGIAHRPRAHQNILHESPGDIPQHFAIGLPDFELDAIAMRGSLDLDVARLAREFFARSLQSGAPEYVGLAKARDSDFPRAIEGGGGGAERRPKNEAHSCVSHACHFPSFWIWCVRAVQ